GQCDYETGDDGRMLTTVLDPDVTSYSLLEENWSVEAILNFISKSSNPQLNALIDTGALITGYSNHQVAQELMKRGLDWCEAVVFLDDEDRKQILVRATGRVIPLEQCGIPLEKRFAFYDQIHTTGMDIKHVVNATALVTLGMIVWKTLGSQQLMISLLILNQAKTWSFEIMYKEPSACVALVMVRKYTF
ncbi:MAG: hypothetical protein AAGM67_21795, partial [Bacteroidota bacterium]